MKKKQKTTAEGRAPQGARGLKWEQERERQAAAESRAPQGARGLKFNMAKDYLSLEGRAPQGARGLKYLQFEIEAENDQVAPRKGRVD